MLLWPFYKPIDELDIIWAVKKGVMNSDNIAPRSNPTGSSCTWDWASPTVFRT